MKPTTPNQMSPAELRALSSQQNTQSEYVHKQTTQVLGAISSDEPVMSASQFVNGYLRGIMSNDQDESEYTVKMLSHFTGDMRKGFIIVDERTGEYLFYVSSLVPAYGTSIGNASTNYSSSNINKSFHDSQFASIPSVRDQNIQDLVMNSTLQLKTDQSEKAFYDSWYEIFDFFGRLYGEELRQYRTIKAYNQSIGQHASFWINELSIEEYIEKHGRETYGFVPPVEKEAETIQEAVVIQEATVSDTSDWE